MIVFHGVGTKRKKNGSRILFDGKFEDDMRDHWTERVLCLSEDEVLGRSKTARDLVLHLGHGVRIDRATTDIDFGIQLTDWNQFRRLKVALLKKGFESNSGTEYRLSHSAGPVDLITFGGVENKHSTVSWPPSRELEMNVLGFQDALTHCELVRVKEEPVVDVPVATPSALSIMKTIAWIGPVYAGRIH